MFLFLVVTCMKVLIFYLHVGLAKSTTTWTGLRFVHASRASGFQISIAPFEIHLPCPDTFISYVIHHFIGPFRLGKFPYKLARNNISLYDLQAHFVPQYVAVDQTEDLRQLLNEEQNSTVTVVIHENTGENTGEALTSL